MKAVNQTRLAFDSWRGEMKKTHGRQVSAQVERKSEQESTISSCGHRWPTRGEQNIR